MFDNKSPNYPDILGYITGDERLTSGVIQAALATNTRVIPAGQTFALLLLLQNLSDVNVEVKATLQVPAQDAKRQKGRLIPESPSAHVTVAPAEVGYLVLPVDTLPDTAHALYTFGMTLEVEPLAKPRRIRQTDGKGGVNLNYYFYLSWQTIERLLKLKNLAFSGGKGLLGGYLETTITIDPPRGKASVAAPKSGWNRLWALDQNSDARPLLERYGTDLRTQILPALKDAPLVKLFGNAIGERVKSTGYAIKSAEAYFIARLCQEVIDRSRRKLPNFHEPEERTDYVAAVLAEPWPTDGTPIPLPNWCRALLGMISEDERVLARPAEALAGSLLNDVIRDAVRVGFQSIKAASRRNLGTAAEIHIYSDYLVNRLNQQEKAIELVDLYLPLVLGGIVIADNIPLPDVKHFEKLKQIGHRVQDEAFNRNADTALSFDVIDDVMEWALRRYTGWQ
ncbi:MAG TPA: hypothetical protein PLQ56_03495 [Aggregatilineales bacterium]|nr:hypothetical protein [Aggregatilineales bacterium]